MGDAPTGAEAPYPDSHDKLYFGPFAFETSTNRLCRDGVEVHLTPKAAAVLRHLVEHPGELISKDEFLETVWQGVHVREESLTQAISVIRQALGDSAQSPQYIQTVSGEGYRFVGEVSAGARAGRAAGGSVGAGAGSGAAAKASHDMAHADATAAAHHPASVARDAAPPSRYGHAPWPLSRQILAAAAVVVVAIGTLAWLWRPPAPGTRAAPDFDTITVTSFPGYENYPTLSPDGQQVAFMWDDGNGPRLYVQFVSGGQPLGLVEARYGDPAWDPTGERIAYMRDYERPEGDEGPAGLEIRTISPLGTDDRRVTTTSSTTTGLDWSPDGRFLAYSDRADPGEPPSIFFLDVDTGDKHRVTFRPGGEATSDQRPAFSPDGRQLAFISGQGGSGGLGEVWLQPLDENGKPHGDARRLAAPHGFLWQVEWTAEGSAVVYSLGVSEDNLYLMSVPIDGSSEPSRLALGDRARDFSIVGNRLVYSQRQDDIDLWRIGGPAAEEPGDPEPWGSSTRDDFAPHYSPHGDSVAFISGRTGAWELWVADADGSNPRQFSDLGHAIFPQYSPDGRRILFSSVAPESGSDVWVVDARGGIPKNLTLDGFDDSIPGWSQSGESMYFQSRREGGRAWEIWGMSLADGALTKITDGGDLRPLHEAGHVYLSRRGRVVRVPEEGEGSGEVAQVIDERVAFQSWTLWEGRIVYVQPVDAHTAAIKILDIASREVTVHAVVPHEGAGWVRLEGSPTVSPDGQFILYAAKATPGGADLILVDNFR